MMDTQTLRRTTVAARQEFSFLKEALRDRGARFFMRPLAIGGLLVAVSYFLIYSYPLGVLKFIEMDLAAARATAKYERTYRDLQSKLVILNERMPTTEDPGDWLLNLLRGSLREESIVASSYAPPVSVPGEGYRLISIAVTFDADYAQVGAWIARLEKVQYLVFVKSLNVTKKSQPVGMNTVEATVTALVPDRTGVL